MAELLGWIVADRSSGVTPALACFEPQATLRAVWMFELEMKSKAGDQKSLRDEVLCCCGSSPIWRITKVYCCQVEFVAVWLIMSGLARFFVTVFILASICLGGVAEGTEPLGDPALG